MIVMAFDIATHTGVALGRAGETPRAISVDFGKRNQAVVFSKVIRLTCNLLTKYKPDILVYESPVGGPKTSHFLVGIAACFAGEASRLGYKPEKLDISSVRKHFLGRNLTRRDFPHLAPGRARTEIKRAVIARCHQLGWRVEDDDQADACALWDYAAATIARTQGAPAGDCSNEPHRAAFDPLACC